MPEAKWEGKSKASVGGYRVFVWIISNLGIRGAYFILLFVSYYYYLFQSTATKSLQKFYSLAFPGLSGGARKKLIQQNFYIFGQTLVDRMALMMEKGDVLSCESKDGNLVNESLNNNKGVLIISGHLGNWSIAGNFLQAKQNKVNIIMFDNEYQKIKSFLKEKAADSYKVIPIKEDLSHLIRIRAALSDNEVVCIDGDRFLPKSRLIKTQFFGEEINLPAGPFEMASKFGPPYIFAFAVKESKFEYAIKLSQPTQETDVDIIASQYAQAMEELLKKYPEQWFNYHDFFGAE